MNYWVNVDYEYRNAKSKFLRLSLLFSLTLTLVLTSDLLLILLANEDFTLNLIIAIVISVLFSWFAIYFFTIIYGDVNARYRYFKGYESGLKSTDEVVFIKKEDEPKLINGLYVYPLKVCYKEGIEDINKIIYTLNNDLKYESGDKLTIETYQRILIKAEKHQ